MRVLVVYELMFGNTEAVTGVVADGLSGCLDVELHEVEETTVGRGAGQWVGSPMSLTRR